MTAKDALIQSLIKDGYLKTPRLIEAFRAIDRADFVPREYADEAYGNYPLPIGHGQTISQPLTVAIMLELLDPQPGEKILDVGAGSGWTTALLAYVVSKSRNDVEPKRGTTQKFPRSSAEISFPRNSANGYVEAIERIPELCKFGEANVRKYNFVEKGVVKFFCGDASRPSALLGASGGEKFDKILAGAAASHEIPEIWKKLLKNVGRIVAPVGQSVVVLDKIGESKFKTGEYFGFSFVPLVED